MGRFRLTVYHPETGRHGQCIHQPWQIKSVFNQKYELDHSPIEEVAASVRPAVPTAEPISVNPVKGKEMLGMRFMYLA